MSFNFSFSNFSTNALQNYYQSFSQVSTGGGFSLSKLGISHVSDSFGVRGGNFSMANVFANLPMAPLPRPPHFGMSLGKAAMSLGNFTSSISQFGVAGGFGYPQFLGISSMQKTVGNFMSTQALYGHSTISNLNVGVDVSVKAPPVLDRKLKDEFAAANSAGKGHQSNLSNSPEVVLALNNILKGHADNMPFDKVQQQLKDQYGIESDFKTVNGRKELQFKNGDKLVDASGNGSLGTKDYKFGKAVADIQKKFNLNPDDMKAFNTEAGKKQLGDLSNWRNSLQLPQEQRMRFEMNQTTISNNHWMGVQNSFLDMNMFQPFFAQAYSMAF